MKSHLPRKQRKWFYTMPLHNKRKNIRAHLSKELRDEYHTRSITVRKGDLVKIMRGKYKRKIGKIIKIFTKKMKVHVEGVTLRKVSGREVPLPLHASNLLVLKIDDSNPKRIEKLKSKYVATLKASGST